MKRRLLLVPFTLLAFALVGCQPNQEFGPNATDTDLWDVYDIRVDTEVPNQYPNGRSGLAGAGADIGDAHDAEPADDH